MFLNLVAKGPCESNQPAPPIPEEDLTLLLFDSLFSNNPAPPQITVPQTQKSTWSTTSPPLRSPSLQSKSFFDLQEHSNTLEKVPNSHNPQTIVSTKSSDTNQQMKLTISSHGPVFLTAASLGATRTPQSILASPLTSQPACINSTSSLPSTLRLNNPPILPNLFSSALTSFPSTQSMQAVDVTQNSTSIPIHQRFTTSSNSRPQISAPPKTLQKPCRL